ncbi:hypothetical protein AMTR_s00072p00171260 [Amborella trichopoda]|uniref:RING-type E3 ubiquitin transferase n=2 Tax=Amborella trichopoda TaxID=13333 RepID=W1NRI5_AMBTC|nr:hypothetical protein AMTR_s00072p00171260 [Amborella trichopoda]
MGSEEGEDIVQSLIDLVKEISELPEWRNPWRKQYYNLVRRVKLLGPLFEELKESSETLNDESVTAFVSLKNSLLSAEELLRFWHEGSKLYQALEREDIMNKFNEVTAQLEQALNGISYDKLDVSDEVREQVELVHAQFKRAKGRMDIPDMQLYMDLSTARNEKETDPAVLKRLSESLQLKTINDLKKESHALHDMVISSGGDPGETFEEMSALLKKLKDYVLSENVDTEASESEKSMEKTRSPVIPDDFRCPISLELMRDPVIVATGQTYEQSCIQKWLDAGHQTCPKTQQMLPHTVLTPNYVLRSLIAQWCENNGVELPKRAAACQSGKSTSGCDRAAIENLLQKLTSTNQEEQRAAAGELRLLAKRNADNRVCIAKAGAIPLLVDLLSSPDPRTQEHAVTALLNLSINDSNKGSIVMAGAIPDIVDVLKSGCMEARENAAATLFSLSVVDDNKVAIGAAGAIPALVDLLCKGSPRGKKDAATALFNLCIYQGNKVRAVRAGVVMPLMRLLMDPGGGMVDEALAILAILVTHPEGKAAIGQAEPVPMLVEFLRTGSPRNRENAASILLGLCTVDAQHLSLARELGAEEAVRELAESGTVRAKRKAGSLLEYFRMSSEQATLPSEQALSS